MYNIYILLPTGDHNPARECRNPMISHHFYQVRPSYKSVLLLSILGYRLLNLVVSRYNDITTYYRVFLLIATPIGK
jgi:hypothetical protein